MRDKFHLTKEIVDDVICVLNEQGEYIDTGDMDYGLPDPKDIVFCEKKGRISCVWKLRYFPKVSYVVTPKETLDILLNEQV